MLVSSIVILVILPWIVRNTLLYHHLTGIDSELGYNLYIGYYPTGTGTFQYPQSLALLSIIDDSHRDIIGMEKALEFIQADPGRIPYLVVLRSGYFFDLELRAPTYFYSNDFLGHIPTPLLLLIASVICLPFVFVSVSAAFGMALTSWRKETLLLVLLFVGYVTPHLLTLTGDRFHLTLVPILAILAAFFWTGGWSTLKARWRTRNGKIAILLASVVVLLLFTNWGFELWHNADKLTQFLGPNGNQTNFSY